MEVAVRLRELAQKVSGVEQYCWRAFADALEVRRFSLFIVFVFFHVRFDFRNRERMLDAVKSRMRRKLI